VNEYRTEREQRERRRRNIMRAVCIVVAVAMLGSLIVPAIYAGLWRCLRAFAPAVERVWCRRS